MKPFPVSTIRLYFVLSTVMIAAAPPVSAQSSRDPFLAARHHLVTEAIESEGITNPVVLKAMRTVPRHEFVAPSLRARAYSDEALPIGSSQTISPPYIVAYMTDALDPQPEDRVLEIGTGSGYQAAVLGKIVQDVYTIEIVSSLAKSATRRLRRLHYDNVHVRDGDGYQGWPEHAPFDRIIVTCSPENVPEPLIDQLRDGGTMIIPIGERYQQTFHLFKKENGKLESEQLKSTLFVPMTGQSEEQRRIQPDADRPEVVNGSFEVDDNRDGNADGWHYQRRSTLVDNSPVDGGGRFLRFSAEEDGQYAQALQGLAVSGKTLAAIDFAIWAQAEDIERGSRREQAALVVHFYDGKRRVLSSPVVARWEGSQSWEETRRRIAIPPGTREMIVRIGLNGALGQLDLDELRIRTIAR